MDTRAASSRANKKAHSKPKQASKPRQGGGSSKARGLEKDSPEVRASKSMSYILRHHAASEGVPMRPDGYVKVTDLLANPRMRALNIDFDTLKEIVASNNKQRFALLHEPDPLVPDDEDSGEWFVRANQGHSIKTIQVEMKEVLSLSDIPTGIAVHGTLRTHWNKISTQGLSRMNRNHIHIAQGLSRKDAISGFRASSDIFIYIDIDKAVASGIKFYLSENGVVLAEGDENGFIPPEYFLRVEDRQGVISGWEEGRQAMNTVTADIETISLVT
ncbi:KptA family-domain-containing protein [Flagelloscypha sp. PMI_526]|nr:KptA family-domain-containing protein [Flagelloscypha sp. PMI_526]